MVEYDPAARRVQCRAEFNYSLGRGRDDFGDGMVHGWLDFFQAGYAASANLVLQLLVLILAVEADYATGYDGISSVTISC